MKRSWLVGGAALVALAGAGTWAAITHWGGDAPPAASRSLDGPVGVGADEGGSDIPLVGGVGDAAAGGDGAIAPVDAGTTPMPRRVAMLGLLNKRNGVTRDVTLRPGQAMRVGDVVIRLRACEETPPWEPQHLTGAFVQLDVQGADRAWRRAFSGWLYKERPTYNVVLHPIYDVWPKSCATTFPGTTPAPASPAPAGRTARSSSARNAAPGVAQGAVDVEGTDAGDDGDARAAASNAT